ncbi:hypothetical protein CR513_25020, partial [Mucuna pruriens]
MTRSSIDRLYAFDPKIEKTLRRLRKARNLVINNSRSSDSVINSNQLCTVNSVTSSNIFTEPRQMENNDRTLKELATLNVRRPRQELEGIPRGLLHNEAVGDIGGLHQNEGVSILPRWSSEGLVVSIATHVPGEVLSSIQNCIHWEGNLWDKVAHRRDFARYFYEGLSMMDKSMIDATSGGALMDKTPTTARHLISNMASNTQQFGIRGSCQSWMMNEIRAASNQRLKNQLTELISLVR